MNVNFSHTAFRSLHTPTMLQRTINPKEADNFYIVVLYHKGVGSILREGLVLKEQDLFYKINPEFGSALIPCGQMAKVVEEVLSFILLPKSYFDLHGTNN